jgi:mannose-6-phosphate isomerase
MFVAIANTPRPYDWGSATAIAELLGTTASGGPEAELWLGAHPANPARILEPALAGDAVDLAAWIAADPRAAVGERDRLPFLLKVLAADAPLSLQAHPTAEQARAGYERENAAGTPLDAPHRNYRDPHPKPEIIYALSETFEALCGFRPVEETRRLFAALGVDGLIPRWESPAALFEWSLVGGADVGAVRDRIVARSKTKENGPGAGRSALRERSTGGDSVVFDRPGTADATGALVETALDTVRLLTAKHPDDTGIVSALLLNRVTLRRGEALFLPTGNIHAYLHGLGVELMTASDNVLRGGLTSKHVDVPELLEVLDFTPGPVPYLRADAEAPNLDVFRPPAVDFVLARVTGEARYRLTGPGIALCTAGSFAIDGATASAGLERGGVVYITPEESALAFAGVGELFLATTP